MTHCNIHAVDEMSIMTDLGEMQLWLIFRTRCRRNVVSQNAGGSVIITY